MSKFFPSAVFYNWQHGSALGDSWLSDNRYDTDRGEAEVEVGGKAACRCAEHYNGKVTFDLMQLSSYVGKNWV